MTQNIDIYKELGNVKKPYINKVMDILRNSNDGDDLSQEHLYLMELTVNYELNEAGKNELNKVYEAVMNGSYSIQGGES